VTPTRDRYDAVVIGAGPAGAVAARELARRGRAVLLVDKSTFPRRKVCGCCLNGNALAALASVGLGDLPARLGAVPLHSLKLAAGGRVAEVPLAGVSLSREAFDLALIEAAVAAGAEFVSGCKATMGSAEGGGRVIRLNPSPLGGEGDQQIFVDFVLVADGLNGRTAATADGFDVPATAASRIGAGVVVNDLASRPSDGAGTPEPASLLTRLAKSGRLADYHPGSIFMATGRGGYVGLVVLEDGRLDLAAAFDPAFIRDTGGLGNAAALILSEAGFPAIPALQSADWKGTPALTRTPDRIAGERWLAVGDACGYVEPFTGEGMAWAVGGAAAVSRLVADGWHPSLPAQWKRLHHRLIGRRQRFCRLLAPALRSRLVRRMMVSALRVVPVLASPFVRGLNRPPALALESPR